MFGVFAAITAAFSWTIACFIWRSQTKYLSAIQLNLFKNLIAALIFSPVLFTIDWVSEFNFVLILLLGGIIGISFGDTFYVHSLRILGTRRTLTVEAFSPILANILGIFLLGEALPIRVWIGCSIVSISLFLISIDKIDYSKSDVHSSESNIRGLFYGLLSVTCAVIAAVLSRFVLTNTNLSPIQSTEIRLLGAIIVLFPLVRLDYNQYLNNIPLMSKIQFLIATLLGTNLGILLQQTSFMLLPIGLAWTLLSISPIISLLFSKYEGDYVDYKKIFLSLIAILGVATALL